MRFSCHTCTATTLYSYPIICTFDRQSINFQKLKRIRVITRNRNNIHFRKHNNHNHRSTVKPQQIPPSGLICLPFLKVKCSEFSLQILNKINYQLVRYQYNMPAIIPPEAVDVVGLIVSIIFLRNYVNAYGDCMNFDENSEEERRLALKRTAYWAGLASWNIAATEQVFEPPEFIIFNEAIQSLFFDEPGLLMVITFILFMLPVLIFLSNVGTGRVAVLIIFLLIILIATWIGVTFWGTLGFLIGAFL